MAPGVLLHVSWICLLLIHSSCASVKGYGKKDIHNNGDDDDDDDVPTYGSVQRPGNSGASASRPSAARWQGLAARKTPVKTGIHVERLQNARPVVGVQERPDQPLVFPMQGGSANNPAPPPSQGSGNPPSSDWRPKPGAGGSSSLGFNSGSGTKGVNNKPLLFEDVFTYSAQGSGAPQSQGGSNPQAAGGGSQASQGSQPGHALPQRQTSNWGAWPFQQSRPVFSHPSVYQPHWGRLSWQQNPVQGYRSPGGSRPVPPPSYIIHSSNKYERFGQTYRRSMYTPEYAVPQPQGSPVPPPAAPPSFQGPQRAKV